MSAAAPCHDVSPFEQYRPWREPTLAFRPLAENDYALLLHDGSNGRARIYAFPDEIFEGEGREVLDRLAANYRNPQTSGELAGLFGYELVSAFENIAAPSTTWPHIALARYPAWAEFDRDAGTICVRGLCEKAVTRLLETLSVQAESVEIRQSENVEWTPNWSQDQYLNACRTARDYVHAGDVFQVNLSQSFNVELDPADTPFSVFERLTQFSPAPHAAYFRIDADRVVLTNSPERFLSVRDGRVEARPIKGTRPRADNPQRDAELAHQLSSSAKDNAENLMIVDLMRNDLARVCSAGSIEVPLLCEVESYANVHHLVSVVEGELRPGIDVFDLIAASFPPGSITGAPKVRAMEIIAELEGEARGPYCGAMGWISKSGDMDLNVMIRTAALQRQDGRWKAIIRSGGGIVAESDPQSEYEETLTKASALRAAFGGGRS
jgi:para-aminobenzoate synthetase component 1